MSTIHHSTALNSGFNGNVTRMLVLAGFACLTTVALAQEEAGVIDKTTEVISNSADAVSTKSEEAWDATKQGAETVAKKSGEVWDDTKDAAGEAWDATKSTSIKAADYTAEKSSQAWDATKEGTRKAVDYTEDTYDRVKESLVGETENDVPVEDKSIE